MADSLPEPNEKPAKSELYLTFIFGEPIFVSKGKFGHGFGFDYGEDASQVLPWVRYWVMIRGSGGEFHVELQIDPVNPNLEKGFVELDWKIHAKMENIVPLLNDAILNQRDFDLTEFKEDIHSLYVRECYSHERERFGFGYLWPGWGH